MYLTTDPLKENTRFADSLRMNWSIVLCWLVIFSSLKWWHSFLCTSDTTTATAKATKTSLKKWSRAASNLIVLIPSRSVRQILAIFSGVENIYKLLVGVRSNTISSSDQPLASLSCFVGVSLLKRYLTRALYNSAPNYAVSHPTHALPILIVTPFFWFHRSKSSDDWLWRWWTYWEGT